MIIITILITSKRIYYKVIELQLIEFIWTLLPCVLLVMLGIPSLNLLYKSEGIAYNASRLTIKVTGHQWYWEYDYSDFSSLTFDSFIIPSTDLSPGRVRFMEVDNRVVVPVETFVQFVVTAADVLHSWAVPRMGIKLDANPGRLNVVSTFITTCGLIFGQCSEICGANHRFIPIVVEATPPRRFVSWVKLV